MSVGGSWKKGCTERCMQRKLSEAVKKLWPGEEVE